MNPTLPPLEVFTKQELLTITTQFAKSRGDKGFTKDELEALLEDAINTRLQNDLLDLLIAGRLLCDWDGKQMMLSQAHEDTPVELFDCPSVSRRLEPGLFLDGSDGPPQSPSTGQ